MLRVTASERVWGTWCSCVVLHDTVVHGAASSAVTTSPRNAVDKHADAMTGVLDTQNLCLETLVLNTATSRVLLSRMLQTTIHHRQQRRVTMRINCSWCGTLSLAVLQWQPVHS